MDTVKVVLIKKGSPTKKSLVELPRMPEVGQTMTISPSEVRVGPQPDGQQVTVYIPARTCIVITTDLGVQEHFGKKPYQTFEYDRGSIS